MFFKQVLPVFLVSLAAAVHAAPLADVDSDLTARFNNPLDNRDHVSIQLAPRRQESKHAHDLKSGKAHDDIRAQLNRGQRQAEEAGQERAAAEPVWRPTNRPRPVIRPGTVRQGFQRPNFLGDDA